MSHLSQPPTSLSSHPEYIFLSSGIGSAGGVALHSQQSSNGQVQSSTSHNNTHSSASSRATGFGSFVAQPTTLSSMNAAGSGSGSSSSYASLKGGYGAPSGSGSLLEAGRKITSQGSLPSSAAAGYSSSLHSMYNHDTSGHNSGAPLSGITPVPLAQRNQSSDYSLDRRGSMPYLSQAAGVENVYTHHQQQQSQPQPQSQVQQNPTYRPTASRPAAAAPAAAPSSTATEGSTTISASNNANGSQTSKSKKPLLPEHYNFDFEAYARKRFGSGGESKSSESETSRQSKPSVKPPSLARASPTAASSPTAAMAGASAQADHSQPASTNQAEPTRRAPTAAEAVISKDYDETLKLWKELGAQKQGQQQKAAQASKPQVPAMMRRGSVAVSSSVPQASPEATTASKPDTSGESGGENASQSNSAENKRKSNVERFWEAERERERLARALGVNRFGFIPQQHLGQKGQSAGANVPTPETKPAQPETVPEKLASQKAEAAPVTTPPQRTQPSQPSQSQASTSAPASANSSASSTSTASAAPKGNAAPTSTPNPVPAPLPPRLHRPAWANAAPIHEEKVLTKEDLLRMKAEIDARFAKKSASTQSTSNKTTSNPEGESKANSGAGSAYAYVNVAREKLIPTPRKPSQQKSEAQPAQQQASQSESQTGSQSNQEASDTSSSSSFAYPSKNRGHRQSMPNIFEGGNSSSYSYANAPSTNQTSFASDTYDMRLANMSAVQIKRELERYGVSTTGLVERSEFAALLKDVWVKRERFFEEQKQKEERELAARRAAEQKQREEAAAAEARAAQRKREREQAAAEQKELEKDDARIIAEVELWAKNKPLYVLLNEVNGDRALKRTDNFATVSKAYRRAIIQIHPDKHMDDHAKFVRATEMCKYVNDAYQTYRKQIGQ